jgi:hypothetical protein
MDLEILNFEGKWPKNLTVYVVKVKMYKDVKRVEDMC